jgi:hypothetical protein
VTLDGDDLAVVQILDLLTPLALAADLELVGVELVRGGRQPTERTSDPAAALD